MESVMHPSVISLHHPLIGAERDLAYDAFLPGENLGTYVLRVGITLPRGALQVLHNGYVVPDALWKKLRPRMGDQVVIRALVRGGHGGGSKVLRTVAMIAVMIASVYVPGLIGLVAGSWQAAAVSAVVMIGGQLLINALLPPPIASGATDGNRFNTSPTYSITGQGNRARPFEPLPIVLGQHKIVPDLASRPYTEFVGEDQYLYQAFNFGLQTDLILSDMKIGDTLISEYSDVQIQASGADGKLPLIAGNVDTLEGFELRNVDNWTNRVSSIDTHEIQIELTAQLYALDSAAGKESVNAVNLSLQYRPYDPAQGAEVGWRNAGGAGVLSESYWSYGTWEPSNSQPINGGYGSAQPNFVWHQITYGSKNFADYYDDKSMGGAWVKYYESTQQGQIEVTVWRSSPIWRWRNYNEIDPNNQNDVKGLAPSRTSDFGETPFVVLTNDTAKPIHKTVRIQLYPSGQYEIRIRKNSLDQNSNTLQNTVAVSQIRSYQDDKTDYSGQRRLAVKIKASSQLSGVINQFNCTAQQIINVWNGSRWVGQVTSNPAWWFLWFARGSKTAAGARRYGCLLPDSQIDIEAIKAWGAFCNQKRLTIGYVLDQKKSSDEMLTLIARCGRATRTWQSGKLGVVWDADQLPVAAMFCPSNIKAGSFQVDYIGDQTADEVIVNFVNPAKQWMQDSVRVVVPGVVNPTNPVTLDFAGCTNANMAGREANLIAASQLLHRRRVSFETDIEGLIASRGNVINFSHDLTVWSFSGRLLQGNRTQLSLDKAVPLSDAGAWLQIRAPDGTMVTARAQVGSGDTTMIQLQSPLPLDFPVPDEQSDTVPMDWMWFFDPLQTPGKLLKITDVQPSGQSFKFQAIEFDPKFYTAENNPYTYVPPKVSNLIGGAVLSLGVTETVSNASTGSVMAQIAWSVTGATSIDVLYSVNKSAQIKVNTSERSYSLPANMGDVITVTVIPIGSTGKGTSKTLRYVVQGLKAPLPAIQYLSSIFRDGFTVLNWRAVIDVRQPDYEVRLGASFNSGSIVGRTGINEMLATGNGSYWVAAHWLSGDGVDVYGPAMQLNINGAALVRNVVLSQAEHLSWAGAVSDGAIVDGGKILLQGTGDVLGLVDFLAEPNIQYYGGVAASGIYTIPIASRVDIGYTAPVRVGIDVDFYGYRLTEDFLSIVDVFAVSDVYSGENSRYVSVTPQIRTDTSDWFDYVPGLINARTFDLRLVLSTTDPSITPVVTAFNWLIDVPDRIERAEGVSIATLGNVITYSSPFHANPNVQISILNAQAGDYSVITSDSVNGFTLQIKNAGSGVIRSVNWIAQSY